MKEITIKRSRECEKILDKINELDNDYDIGLNIDVWLEEIADNYVYDESPYDDFDIGFAMAVNSIKQNKQVFCIAYCNDNSWTSGGSGEGSFYFLVRSEKELIDLFNKKLKEADKEVEQYKKDEEQFEQEQETLELEQAKQAKEAVEKKIAELTKKVSKSKKQTKKATKETKNKPEAQEPIEEGFTL